VQHISPVLRRQARGREWFALGFQSTAGTHAGLEGPARRDPRQRTHPIHCPDRRGPGLVREPLGPLRSRRSSATRRQRGATDRHQPGQPPGSTGPGPNGRGLVLVHTRRHGTTGLSSPPPASAPPRRPAEAPVRTADGGKGTPDTGTRSFPRPGCPPHHITAPVSPAPGDPPHGNGRARAPASARPSCSPGENRTDPDAGAVRLTQCGISGLLLRQALSCTL
jgi:hypothetical protein